MRHYWVDRIIELEPGKRAVGLKSVSLSEDVLHDHFPGNPVFPGIYLIEGLAQVAGVLLARSGTEERFALMNSVQRVRFSTFVRPGDTVRLSVEIEQLEADSARVHGTAEVGCRRAATARLTFRLIALDEVIPKVHQPLWAHSISMMLGEYGSKQHE